MLKFSLADVVLYPFCVNKTASQLAFVLLIKGEHQDRYLSKPKGDERDMVLTFKYFFYHLYRQPQGGKNKKNAKSNK